MEIKYLGITASNSKCKIRWFMDLIPVKIEGLPEYPSVESMIIDSKLEQIPKYLAINSGSENRKMMADDLTDYFL